MPITPIPEKPPVKRARNAIDWTDTIDALQDDPGEWFKVDGPLASNKVNSREKSLAKFAEAAEVDIEVTHRNVDGAHWIYARTVDAKAAPKAPPLAAVTAPRQTTGAANGGNTPASAPSPIHDDGTHPHQCDTCGDTFRTNTRLRQHQANAHKAS